MQADLKVSREWQALGFGALRSNQPFELILLEVIRMEDCFRITFALLFTLTGFPFMGQRSCAPMLASVLFSLVAFAQSPNLSVTKTADATPVPTGTTIGFTITVSNSNVSGTATAANVMLNDPLPAGTGLNWSINPAYGGPGTCNISAQILSCAFGDMAPGDQAVVHLQSLTNPPPGSSAGAYTNIAIASADNEQPVPSLAATIVVTAPQVPNVTVLKTADASPVATGMPISFTITVNNSNAVGTGTAFNVVLNDSFPAGPGLNW